MLPPALFVKTQGLALLLPSKARREDKATDVGKGELQWPLRMVKSVPAPREAWLEMGMDGTSDSAQAW